MNYVHNNNNQQLVLPLDHKNKALQNQFQENYHHQNAKIQSKNDDDNT